MRAAGLVSRAAWLLPAVLLVVLLHVVGLLACDAHACDPLAGVATRIAARDPAAAAPSPPAEASEAAAPTERQLYNYGLTGPVYDVALFPALKKVQALWETMRAEALAITRDMAMPRTVKHPLSQEENVQVFLEIQRLGNYGWVDRFVGWKNYVIVAEDQVVPGETAELCPATAALLRSISGVRVGGFSKLLPNAHIEPHTDALYRSLSFHVYLTGHARMRVGNVWVDHTPGNAAVFDGNWPHEVINGHSERIILYVELDIDKFFLGTEGIDLSGQPQRLYDGPPA